MTELELRNKLADLINDALDKTDIGTIYGALHIAMRGVEVLFDSYIISANKPLKVGADGTATTEKNSDVSNANVTGLAPTQEDK